MEWYSNSSVPAELARFDGIRIGVLGDFGMRMELGLAREFSALNAEVTLLRALETRHVVELLAAFERAKRPGRPQAGVGWP
jgi:hypothetical protein